MILQKAIDWLSRRMFVNLLLIALYFVLVVLPHKRFGTFLNEVVFNGITRDQYNTYVIIGASFFLLLYLVLFLWNSLKCKHRYKLWGYMAINIALAILTINLLFVINIEVVHFPQYAFLVLLLYPLIGNYTGTLVWAVLLGLVDESYQYFYLAPMDTSYLDLNDVVTNLIGAVFGLLLLSSFKIATIRKFAINKTSIWYGLGFVIMALAVTHLLGLISIYPNEDRPYHILREWPPGFWSKQSHGVIFHVIRPIEGLCIVVLLVFMYRKLGPDSSSTQSQASPEYG